MSEILILSRVHARDAAGPRGRARGAVSEVSLALGPGLHAALGAPEDGTLALFDAVTGARAPQRGKVLVGGREPAKAAPLRARIGALGADPRLPPARTVREAIRAAMIARGEDPSGLDAALDPFGLSRLLPRAPGSLSFAEARAVELAIALTTPSPLLLALHEPLAEVALPSPDIVRRRLGEAAAAGACVLVTTSSPADARALADRIFVLHKGLLVREAAGGAGLVLSDEVELTAWVRTDAPSPAAPIEGDAPAQPVSPPPGPRELAAALGAHPAVRGVSWDDAPGALGASAAWPGTAPVRVRGAGMEACAAALVEAALAAGVTIEAISPSAPGLSEVRAATDTLVRMRIAAMRPAGAGAGAGGQR